MNNIRLYNLTPKTAYKLQLKMNTAIKESLLEGARVVALSVIPLLIDGVSQWAIDWRAVIIVAIITVLRMVDKWAYENGKAGSVKLNSKIKLPF